MAFKTPEYTRPLRSLAHALLAKTSACATRDLASLDTLKQGVYFIRFSLQCSAAPKVGKTVVFPLQFRSRLKYQLKVWKHLYGRLLVSNINNHLTAGAAVVGISWGIQLEFMLDNYFRSFTVASWLKEK